MHEIHFDLDTKSRTHPKDLMPKGQYKTKSLPFEKNQPRLAKPDWIKIRLPSRESAARVEGIKSLRKKRGLFTVCEEASCPNLSECFSHGTATFMIMGGICTRKCPFCDVAHGRPEPLDANEPAALAETVKDMGLVYVVVTSVDRDDLKDGGAAHFRACIEAIRDAVPGIKVEILTPDFRAREAMAVEILHDAPPDVFNHNLETVPRLYRYARPGADYEKSLGLIKAFKKACPEVPTKSGIMVGLGETEEEIYEVLRDLRAHDCDMLTIGQYLQPSTHHLPVDKYYPPEDFVKWQRYAESIGFVQVASGPLVRSSYHADLQASQIVNG